MEARDDWDLHWEQYAATAARNPAQQMRHRIIARLLRAMAAGSRGRILDIGSGQGDLCTQLVKMFPEASVAGFELSERGVAVSRLKVPAAKFHVVDLFSPPAEAKDYLGWANAAVCSEVLEHVDSPVAFLRASREYLTEGCRLVVTVPGGPMSAFDRHIGHRQHFTRASISNVLTEAGFEIEAVFLAGFPFFNLYRLAVILRGEKLVRESVAGGDGKSGGGWLVRTGMSVFGVLFRLNLLNSPWGWQVVVVARKV